MFSNKQFFLFDAPVKELISKISGHQAHFFANDINGMIVMANDLQAEYFCMDSVNSMIGQNISDFIPKAEVEPIKSNNIVTVDNDNPQVFYEVGLGNECLCIKTRLKDSSNHAIGIGGLAFYFHQIVFGDIISLIKRFVYLIPATNKLKHSYTTNGQIFKLLTNREQQCVYCLARGMTYKEIGWSLGITSRTVETHMVHIKSKLRCNSRSDIIAKIFEGDGGSL